MAARRLGCHVETLRIRVRNGRLPAVRGAHGAYYVSEEALAALPPLDRRISSEAAPTPAERERSWELVEQQVTRSRLADRSPFLAVRKALFNKTTRADAEARRRARRIVAELRARLLAGGFQPHLDTGRDATWWPAAKEDQPRPAFTEPKLSSSDRRYLQAAGLSEAQIDAIATVGLGTDELQELLLRGINRVGDGGPRR